MVMSGRVSGRMRGRMTTTGRRTIAARMTPTNFPRFQAAHGPEHIRADDGRVFAGELLAAARRAGPRDAATRRRRRRQGRLGPLLAMNDVEEEEAEEDGEDGRDGAHATKPGARRG